MRSLESYRGKDFVGVEDLAGVAAEFAQRFHQEPERGNVRMAISQRIVRHYLAEDLLGDSSGQSGTSIVFNYGNLLRLLAVKKLLADNWSVIKIREFMSVLDITALEHLINSAFASSRDASTQKDHNASNDQARSFSLRSGQQRGTGESSNVQSRIKSNAKEEPMPLASLVIASARRAERIGVEWIEIAPGLEVKARRSFQPPRSEEERERIVARFLAVVNKRRGA